MAEKYVSHIKRGDLVLMGDHPYYAEYADPCDVSFRRACDHPVDSLLVVPGNVILPILRDVSEAPCHK